MTAWPRPTQALALAMLVALTGCQSAVRFQGAPLSATDPSPTHTVQGVLAKPDGSGPVPAVVLLPTCNGMCNRT